MRTQSENPKDAMARARLLAQSGDLAGAAEMCASVVAREPANFLAFFMLGTIESALQRWAEAADHLAQAVRLNPRSAEALTSYGNALIEGKRHAEAVAVLNEALRLQPKNATALLYRGLALAETGRHAEALGDFERTLELDPQSIYALHNRANALIALNRHKEARASVERLLRIAPNFVPALANWAVLLMAERRHREALATLDRALSLEPDNPELMRARADALLGLKRHEEALATYDRAIALKPRAPELHIGRGNVLSELGRHDEALAVYDKALQLSPENPAALLNRANMLMEKNRLTEALAACDQAIAAKPDYGPALVLRGNILLHLERSEDALAAYDEAVKLRPDYPEAHYHRGSALLLHGRLREGFREFEHRWDVADCVFERPSLEAAPWHGEPLEGRSIIVFSEQGLGDTIQFVRFLPRLAHLGAKVTFLCHPNLIRLFRSYAAVAELIGSCEASRPFDFQCALMSLPERFGTELESLPRDVPYLAPEPALLAKWQERLEGPGFKVGICWQGNPKGQIDKGRSVPLIHYAPLAAIPGVRLISLQKNDGLDQLARLPAAVRIETLGPFDEGDDSFIDTAAIMGSLDLVVTSDTAIAHLSGALGRPTWVALKHIPDWRWMLGGSECPWYPTMRLFRQPARGDWESVFAEIARALRALVEENGAP